MPTVNMRFFVPATAPEVAYERISNFERYPEFTDTVISIVIDETDPSEQSVTSTWTVKFRRGTLRWTERDRFDRANGTIEFEQLAGDFDTFGGAWRVGSTQDGTQIDFVADFDLGMPTLSDILDPVAEKALRENIFAILRGLLGEVRLAESVQRG